MSIVRYRGGATGAAIIPTVVGAEDQFEIAFQPARPVLDAVVELWKPLLWLNQNCQPPRRLPVLDLRRANEHRDTAVERCQLIPQDPELYVVSKLFEEAECKPAPETWFHIAIGLMLQSLPAAATVSDTYRCGLADSVYRDPEIWGRYSPGFSAPVVVRSIREARRQSSDLPPSPGTFLAMCSKHRDQFRRWRADIDTLVEIRQNAEDVLIALGDERLSDLGTDHELESKDLEPL
jgi:hypothetical protein